MTDVHMQDLKQFITVSLQATARATDMSAVKTDVAALKVAVIALGTHMDRRFAEVMAAIADNIITTNDYVDGRLTNHKRRLRKVEKRST